MHANKYRLDIEFKKSQSRAPLFEAVTAYRKRRPGYICIPGHRYGRSISDLWLREVEYAIFSYDLTEASGLDMTSTNRKRPSGKPRGF